MAVMTPKKYITQLTGEDMKELAQATNLEPGFLIRIDKSQGKIKIGIDENALALAINGFFRNGGCNTNAANCVNVPFEPPS
jgi:hypothetical protein